MIPAHFHLVWIGRNFPFPCRLAVESILQTNPGLPVTIHFEDPPTGNPDWEALAGRVEMRPVEIASLLTCLPSGADGDSLRSLLARISASYPAGRSNILRYLVLFAEGGIYLDFDTITLGSFIPLLTLPGFVGEETVWKKDDARVQGKWDPGFLPAGAGFGVSWALARMNVNWMGDSRLMNAADRLIRPLWAARKLNNAVLGACPGNRFFEKALALAAGTDPKVRFGLGPILLNRVWEGPEHLEVHRFPEERFYFIPPSQTFRFFEGPPPAVPAPALVAHWCSSNHRTLAPHLTREAIAASDSRAPLYYQLAKKVMRVMPD